MEQKESILALLLFFTMGIIAYALSEQKTDAYYAAPTNVFAAAGIPYDGPVFSNGTTVVRGVIRYPGNEATGAGIRSAVVFYHNDVTPTNGAVILWKDASHAEEMGRFSKE